MINNFRDTILFKILKNCRNYVVALSEFNQDRKFFCKHYINPFSKSVENLEYSIMLSIHQIEKGLSCKNIRPFGVEKVKSIINNLNELFLLNNNLTFEMIYALNILNKYCTVYEENNWITNNEYLFVKKFLNNNSKKTFDMNVGAHDIYKKDILCDANIDYDKFLSSRKSIRNFMNKKLNSDDITKAVNMAIKSPSACNRQMCKVYYIAGDDNKKVVEKYAQGLGLFDLTNANYFVITFDISANHFIGERNQGWFNAGLFGMNFVNALHSLGIGSCFIQFGNTFKEEKEFKKLLDIPSSERVAVIITAGYYDEVSRIPYSTRKDISEIYRVR